MGILTYTSGLYFVSFPVIARSEFRVTDFVSRYDYGAGISETRLLREKIKYVMNFTGLKIDYLI